MFHSSFHYPPHVVHNETEPQWLPQQQQVSLTNDPNESSLDAVEHAEQLYVEKIRASLLYRPEPSTGSSSNHMTSLIYPVVGISQQSQSKLISDIIAHFNEESDCVNLAFVRGEGDGASSSAEGTSLNHSGTMPHWQKYHADYQNLLRQYDSDDVGRRGQANITAPFDPKFHSKPQELIQSRLSTSGSMMSINSDSSGSLEDLNIDNSDSF